VKRPVSLTYSPKHIYHHFQGIPENPERIESIIKYIRKQGYFSRYPLKYVEITEPASYEDVVKVHDEGYLSFIEELCSRGGGFIGDSTYLNRFSFMAALIAANACIAAVDEVLDTPSVSAYALVRPPGHHASRSTYGGYCIINNAAVAAEYLLGRGISRIMIIDWDAHAAHGTMDIFYERDDVFLISIHRDPRGYYPNDGFVHQVGRGRGAGCTVNIPMPRGAGDAEYWMAWDEIVEPLVREYEPTFVIAENGFDAHHSHTDVGLTLTSSFYYEVVERIHGWRIPFAVLQEGGYTSMNRYLAENLICGLLGLERPRVPSSLDISSRVVMENRVRRQVIETIKKVKSALSPYYDLR